MPLSESDALVAMLPQRPPFLFVDAVDAIEFAVSIEARYLVTGDEALLHAGRSEQLVEHYSQQ